VGSIPPTGFARIPPSALPGRLAAGRLKKATPPGVTRGRRPDGADEAGSQPANPVAFSFGLDVSSRDRARYSCTASRGHSPLMRARRLSEEWRETCGRFGSRSARAGDRLGHQSLEATFRAGFPSRRLDTGWVMFCLLTVLAAASSISAMARVAASFSAITDAATRFRAAMRISRGAWTTAPFVRSGGSTFWTFSTACMRSRRDACSPTRATGQRRMCWRWQPRTSSRSSPPTAASMPSRCRSRRGVGCRRG